MEKFYLTTAIAYASRKPHFGNTYEIIMSDAFARFQKSQGKDVFLCTGTDEHGQKIENLATEAGITPQAYVDGVSGEIKKIWDLMGVEYDHKPMAKTSAIPLSREEFCGVYFIIHLLSFQAELPGGMYNHAQERYLFSLNLKRFSI